MHTSASARTSRFQTGAMQLSASLNGAVYGIALVGVAPLAWTAGKVPAALLIAVLALFGIAVEGAIYSRREAGTLSPVDWRRE